MRILQKTNITKRNHNAHYQTNDMSQRPDVTCDNQILDQISA